MNLPYGKKRSWQQHAILDHAQRAALLANKDAAIRSEGHRGWIVQTAATTASVNPGGTVAAFATCAQ